MITKNKYWTHKGFGSGFGDLINHVSYEMRIVTDPIRLNWCLQTSANNQVKRILEFLEPNDLIEHTFSNTIVEDKAPKNQRDHEYWPNKVLHKGGDYVCVWLYTKHKGGFHEDKVPPRHETISLIQSLKRNGNKVFVIPSVSMPGETLYSIDYDFPQYTKMITHALENCKYFICSEGGLAHFARTMRVPSLVYFRVDENGKSINRSDLVEFWTTDYSKPINNFAGVAQLAEQLICNQQVAGSSPIASSRT